METISVITKDSIDYGSRQLQNAFASRLREIAEAIPNSSLTYDHLTPEVLWQEVHNRLEVKEEAGIERFKDAFKIIRANSLDAAQILRCADFAFCETLLSKAIETKESAAVEFVLSSLTDKEREDLINFQGETWRLNSPLSIACALRSPEAEKIFDLLVEYGADPRQSSCSFMNLHLPIHAAAYAGNLAIVKKILEQFPEQIDLESKYWGDKNGGGTPLALARLAQQEEIVEYLLSQGATK